MTIHAIIWDIGGVLERTENPAPRENLAKRLSGQSLWNKKGYHENMLLSQIKTKSNNFVSLRLIKIWVIP